MIEPWAPRKANGKITTKYANRSSEVSQHQHPNDVEVRHSEQEEQGRTCRRCAGCRRAWPLGLFLRNTRYHRTCNFCFLQQKRNRLKRKILANATSCPPTTPPRSAQSRRTGTAPETTPSIPSIPSSSPTTPPRSTQSRRMGTAQEATPNILSIPSSLASKASSLADALVRQAQRCGLCGALLQALSPSNKGLPPACLICPRCHELQQDYSFEEFLHLMRSSC